MGTLTTGGNGGAQSNWGAEVGAAGGKGGDLGQDGATAGKAVITNGKTINWISGNDATHVKGAIQ